MLITITSCISLLVTYILLNSEDHRWHWTNYLASASTALYIFGYSIYYFMAKTTMYGVFQTLWFFGYTALGCVGLGLMLGCVGHVSSEWFVRKIYANVKID